MAICGYTWLRMATVIHSQSQGRPGNQTMLSIAFLDSINKLNPLLHRQESANTSAMLMGTQSTQHAPVVRHPVNTFSMFEGLVCNKEVNKIGARKRAKP